MKPNLVVEILTNIIVLILFSNKYKIIKKLLYNIYFDINNEKTKKIFFNFTKYYLFQ